MRGWQRIFLRVLVLGLSAGWGWAQGLEEPAARLLAEANASRRAARLPPLRWDRALAQAADRHCKRMADEGPIEHQYPGEADPSARASAAGARFSQLAENVAVASEVGRIHPGWMNSPPHRANLLNPQLDAVGIAVVRARGLFYAVADYSRQVSDLAPDEVEAAFAARLRALGLAIEKDARPARAACAAGKADGALPQPALALFWQGSDPSLLPENLVAKIKSGHYHSAVAGACPAQSDRQGFTQFRMAVLLYE